MSGDFDQDCIFGFVFSSSGGTNLSVDWANIEPPCDDLDNDGICDEDDDCVGEYTTVEYVMVTVYLMVLVTVSVI